MGRIVPHLWYDKEAKEAALLYISLFEKSRLLSTNIIEDTPSGNAEIVSLVSGTAGCRIGMGCPGS